MHVKPVTTILLVGLLTISTCVYAQESIPVGTILPAQLETSLSKKCESCRLIKARVIQDVPLGKGMKILAGAKVMGEVVEMVPAGSGTKAEISSRFDRLVVSHHTIPITTDLRALASMMEVDEAQIPSQALIVGLPLQHGRQCKWELTKSFTEAAGT
jgi:hypothetical protein